MELAKETKRIRKIKNLGIKEKLGRSNNDKDSADVNVSDEYIE